MQYMVEYFEAGRQHPTDCYPDYFATREEAEREGARFMREDIDWALRMKVIEAPTYD